MSDETPAGVPETSTPGFGQPAPAADVPAEAPAEGSTPEEAAGGAHEATQAPQAAQTFPAGQDTRTGYESAADRKARLQKELDEAQAEIDAEQAERLANASPEELCPTCGQLPPPADPPAGHREIWCPDCGQKLADLPAGH